MIILSSCNSKKNLLESQSFLTTNKIQIKSDHSIHNKVELKEALQSIYRQRQTKYSLGFPRHVFYYNYQKKIAKKPNSKKWDEERIIKNRPIIFDSLKAAQTQVDFTKYLAFRGYRAAFVTYDARTRNKSTEVRYAINLGPRLMIDSLIIIAEDSSLQEIIDQQHKSAFSPSNSPLDIQLYNQEKVKLARLIQNQGYATFDETYILPLEVDTSQHRVIATMRLTNPTDSTFHKKYRVGEVTVYPDYSIVAPVPLEDTLINHIRYFVPDKNSFTLKPDMIERNIFVRSGDFTNTDHLEHTRKNLARIELIKFVSPSALIDTSANEFPSVDYSFYLTRNKKINFDLSGELTYSNIASQTRKSLFGTSFSSTYRDRNIFGKAEVLNVNMELGFDFNFVNKDQAEKPPLLNSFNTGLEGSLAFRRFMDPLNLYQLFGRSRKVEKSNTIATKINKWLLEDATTRVGAGFDYVIISDFFDYYNVNVNLSYDVQPDPFKKLYITRIGFDLYVPTAKPAYQKILDQNKFLAESFGNQLYTGLLFKSYLYEINSKDKARIGRFKLLHNFELSGLEMLGINSIVNVINNNTKEIVLNPNGGPDKTVQFSQYARGEIDLRYYLRLSSETTFAAKFNIGIASPFGPFTKQTPYPRQFFVGGALSNRAWQVRQLGPGGYNDTTTIDPNLPYYQTGDFKLDLSAELRFNLFWYFKGVVFVDAANVWILKNDLTRPGANLSSDFINQLGIGYGYGIRLDLDFFIIRLDLGYKLHNPFPVDGSRWLKQRFPKGSIPQIAIGHKF